MHQIMIVALIFLLITLYGSCRALTIGDRDTPQSLNQDLLEPKLEQSHNLKNKHQNLINVPKPIYSPQCDAGYTSVEGNCYRYYSEIVWLTYPNFNSVCQTDNPRAFLATPELSADNDEFGVIIEAYFPTANDFWIGYRTDGAFSSPDLATITIDNSNNAPVNVDVNRWRTSTPTSDDNQRTLFVSSVGADWKVDVEIGGNKHSYLCQH